MRLSARNIFKGRVVSVVSGPIMAKVSVDIGGGNIMTALISAESVEELGIVEGARMSAIVKATEVMLAADD